MLIDEYGHHGLILNNYHYNYWTFAYNNNNMYCRLQDTNYLVRLQLFLLCSFFFNGILSSLFRKRSNFLGFFLFSRISFCIYFITTDETENILLTNTINKI